MRQHLVFGRNTTFTFPHICTIVLLLWSVILSFTEGVKDVYTIDFGDENRMPSCSCEDWASSAYPCKHFFAVFEKFPEWGWEKLSPLYRDSPFLTLDEDVVGNLEEAKTAVEQLNQSILDTSSHHDPEFPDSPTQEQHKTITPSLPRPKYPSKSSLSRAKAALKSLNEMVSSSMMRRY